MPRYARYQGAIVLLQRLRAVLGYAAERVSAARVAP